MGNMVGSLMQSANAEMCRQAQQIGANAILGLSFNVTNDSSGEHGTYKNVICTLMGTPVNLDRTGGGGASSDGYSAAPIAAVVVPSKGADYCPPVGGKSEKQACKYGERCHDVTPEHRARFSHPESTRQMMVTVPDGVSAGQVVKVKAPDGTDLQVTVPAGYGPGQQFAATY